jgi:hypothetical protein
MTNNIKTAHLKVTGNIPVNKLEVFSANHGRLNTLANVPCLSASYALMTPFADSGWFSH